MKIISLSKALILCIIVGNNCSVLCADKKGTEAAKSAGGTKSGGDNRKAIVLDVDVKSASQYKYEKSGNIETFTVYQGFKFSQAVKGGKSVWTPKKSGGFAKQIIINTTTNKLRAVYLDNAAEA